MEFFVFILSVPIFYVLGLIKFISFFTSKNKNTLSDPKQKTIDFLTTAIADLKAKVQTSPNQSIQDLLHEYDDKLKKMTVTPLPNISAKPQSIPVAKDSKKSVFQEDVSTLWSNWYSNNSINLLLYVGAFLIVTSAAIFVGFQWETISGIAKAGILTILTIAFFGFGFWFSTLSKIKNAGETFIAIGAVLIPVCGAAWYNFVFKYMDPAIGPIWLITSLISIAVYIFLANTFRNTFYSYATSVSTLSFSLSLVNTLDLQKDFYILASVAASFILLLISTLSKKFTLLDEKTFAMPSEISSQIFMPLSLIYGFSAALSDNKIFSFEAVLSAFLASGFYFLSYRLSPQPWKLATTQVLLPVGIILFSQWQGYELIILHYMLTICAVGYTAIAYILQRGKHLEEAQLTLSISLLLSIGVYLYAWTHDTNSIHLATFAFVPMILGGITAYIKKNSVFLLISTIFLALFTFTLQYNVFSFTNNSEYLSLPYSIYAIGWYFVLTSWKEKKEFLPTSVASIVFFLSLALLSSFGQFGYMATIAFIITVLFAHAAITFSRADLLFGSTLFTYITVYFFLQFINADPFYYSFSFAAMGYLLYVGHLFISKNYAFTTRTAALISSAIMPIFSLNLAYVDNNYSINTASILERNAIIASYATLLLFGIETLKYKTKDFGYITSAIGMITFLWHIKYLGFTDTQVYTIPLGIYFAALAYTKKLTKEFQNMQALDLTALFFLLIPTTMLSFGDNPMKYSITLGIEGIILLAIGISLSYKNYIYGGLFGIIFAVLPQTYTYILSLPRWLVVGSIGIVFLTVAIFLLLKRTEEK